MVSTGTDRTMAPCHGVSTFAQLRELKWRSDRWIFRINSLGNPLFLNRLFLILARIVVPDLIYLAYPVMPSIRLDKHAETRPNLFCIGRRIRRRFTVAIYRKFHTFHDYRPSQFWEPITKSNQSDPVLLIYLPNWFNLLKV